MLCDPLRTKQNHWMSSLFRRSKWNTACLLLVYKNIYGTGQIDAENQRTKWQKVISLDLLAIGFLNYQVFKM